MESQQSPFDKRTLLAFALMFLVWFGWMAIFPSPKPEPPVAEDLENTAAEVAATDPDAMPVMPTSPERLPAALPGEGAPDSEGEGASFTGWTQRSEGERGETILVRTPNFEAEIDAVGGDILRWSLLQFTDADGEAIDLVGPRTTDIGTQRANAMRLILPDRALDLRDVAFEPSTTSIVLAADDAPRDLVLRAPREEGGSLDLIYRFDPERYGFDVTVEMRDVVGGRVPIGYEIAWPGGIASTEPDSAAEYREFRAVARIGEDIHKVKYDKLRKGDGTGGTERYEGSVSWAGVQGKYFLAAIIDPEPKLGMVRLGGDSGRGVQSFSANLAMRGSAPAQARYTVYFGPVDFDRLSRYDKDPWNAQLTKLVDLGPAIFRPVAEVTLAGLRLLHRVVPNWGWTIVLFSALTKLLFWPLTKSSTQSMKRMQEIQPEVQRLREKYKDDQQKQSSEMLRLYKENKVNPVGGCLPLVVQMPVFYALFTILRKTIDLRQADWTLWVTDLSQPDVLFQLPFTLPVLGNHFSLLPFLMAIGMWAQTKLQAPSGAQPQGQMQQQMKMMSTLMPIMMFFLFYKSPSGLVLYWLVNTVLSAAQTWRIHQQSTPVATTS